MFVMFGYSPGFTFYVFSVSGIVYGAIAWFITNNFLTAAIVFGSFIALYVLWFVLSWISGVADSRAYSNETINSNMKLAKYGLKLKNLTQSSETDVHDINLDHIKFNIRTWLLDNEGATTEQIREVFPIKDFDGEEYEDILTILGIYGICRFGQNAKGRWFSMQNEEVAAKVHRMQRENSKKPKLVEV